MGAIFGNGIIGGFLTQGGSAAVYALGALAVLLCIIPPYLLGSINFALVFSKLIYHDDIRRHGSGNAGMTNMLRTYGKGAAVLTLLCDMFKSSVAVIFGSLIFGVIGAYIAGLFCILGHIFPIFFKFKGGKGVATVAAMILTLDPLTFVLLLAIFLAIVAGTKFVSLGSVLCMMIYPVLTYKLAPYAAAGYLGFPVLITFLVAAVVIFMHRENIKRILAGTENKISFSKKNEKDKK